MKTAMTHYSMPRELSQNDQLPIRIVSPDFGHLPQKAVDTHSPAHRLPYYFLLFVIEGTSCLRVDMDEVEVGKNELLFSLPHQMQQLPDSGHGTDYFKVGFDHECLSRLPKSYPFLLNPLNQHKVTFNSLAAVRLRSLFGMLKDLLSISDTDPELILAHLNSLLTEINAAYLEGRGKTGDERIDKFIGFKLFVENNLTEHPTIRDIAESLAVSQDSLYQIVKQYSGLSPKEFVTNRLILEARRRIHYGGRTSVKELAFDLGFNDPDYFSRLFKKVTGKTVAGFFQDLS